MNLFAEYSRSAAFRIELSERMVRILLYVAGIGPCDSSLNMQPYQALARRGLIEWRGEGMDKHGPYITEAGTKLVELLQMAGYAADDKRSPATKAKGGE